MLAEVSSVARKKSQANLGKTRVFGSFSSLRTARIIPAVDDASSQPDGLCVPAQHDLSTVRLPDPYKILQIAASLEEIPGP
ncbi:MAG: hypothetical protein V4793_07640, partial [Paraburkholderia tropica]